MTAISERTTLTLSLVAGLIGASGFITNIHFAVQANAEGLAEFKSDVKTDLQEIKAEVKENNRLIVEFLQSQAKLKK